MKKQCTLRRCVSTVVGFDRKINIPKGQWLSDLGERQNHLKGLSKQSAWCQPQSFGFSVSGSGF